MTRVRPVRIERTEAGYRVCGRGVDATVKTFNAAWDLSRYVLSWRWHY
jgi:hypothetical protein